MEIKEKYCTHCYEKKSTLLFNTTTNSKTGVKYFRSYCRKCGNKKRNICRKKRPDYREYRNAQFRRQYARRKRLGLKNDYRKTTRKDTK